MFWLVRRGWSPLRLIAVTGFSVSSVNSVISFKYNEVLDLSIILTGHGGFASGMEKAMNKSSASNRSLSPSIFRKPQARAAYIAA